MTAVAYAALAVAAAEAALLGWGPFRIAGTLSYIDVPYIALLVLCAALALPRRDTLGARMPPARPLVEALLFSTIVLFLFGYIYAANANMDYAQRVAASGGNVRLAPNTRAERLAVAVRYVPILLVAAWAWGADAARRRGPQLSRLDRFGFPLALVSAPLIALCFPCRVAPEGLGPLALLAWVPLFAVLGAVGYGRGVFYGTASWTVATMLSSSWLGTYSLVSLQLVTVVLALEGAALFAPALALKRLLRRRLPGAAFLVLPLAWTVFDWLRSVGFAGYPWILAGTTQHAAPAAIQLASLTGVWGVGFVVLLVDAGVAELAGDRSVAARIRTVLVALGPYALSVAAGAIAVALPEPPASGTVRLALVQQNDDPRKNDYERTFQVLRRLTDSTLERNPDLVVWSETAFVPNIRRWSAEDPAVYPLAALVRQFLAYQEGLGTWLLTGNDDYELLREEGQEVRLDYNGAILFSPAGERVDTYHKMRLVPFTESFPWKRELPGVHEALKRFDVYLWEPGTERLVFEHPTFDFCTPICFEDAFPDHVRRFVLRGVDVIVNISNDYWSLTEVEARQHAANAVFRAVENRRPVVRATSSGLTAHIDSRGRLVASLPCYVEGALVVDVPLAGRPGTLYAAWGDWFPAASATLLLSLGIGAALRSRRRGGVST